MAHLPLRPGVSAASAAGCEIVTRSPHPAALARVVKPGGRIASLEFGDPPRRLTRPLWHVYTRAGLPSLGRLVSRDWYEVGRFLGPSIMRFYERCPIARVVALGAAAAPSVHGDRVGAALLAFFLAVGVGAHAFDELHDRPLGTGLSSRTLATTKRGFPCCDRDRCRPGSRRYRSRWRRSSCSEPPSASHTAWSSSAGAFTTRRGSRSPGAPSRP